MNQWINKAQCRYELKKPTIFSRWILTWWLSSPTFRSSRIAVFQMQRLVYIFVHGVYQRHITMLEPINSGTSLRTFIRLSTPIPNPSDDIGERHAPIAVCNPGCPGEIWRSSESFDSHSAEPNSTVTGSVVRCHQVMPKRRSSLTITGLKLGSGGN